MVSLSSAETPPLSSYSKPANAITIKYRFGPLKIGPGQNLIKVDVNHQRPSVPGYITAMRPGMIRVKGEKAPQVDEIHLHHAVWLVNGRPQWAAGEEKSYLSLPQGFGWRYTPDQEWQLGHMIHNLSNNTDRVYLTYELDFVPDIDAGKIKQASTLWLDVVGGAYPIFDVLRGSGQDGIYRYPRDASPGASYRGSWTASRNVTLIATVGHLHPGGLWTDLRVTRNGRTVRIFRSRAHYFDRRGPVSWDMTMTATPADWRVAIKAGDRVSIEAAYETRRASWYEVMGIMPVSIIEGSSGRDPFASDISTASVLTHGRLSENRDRNIGQPNPAYNDARKLKDGPLLDTVYIKNFTYSRGDLAASGRAALPPVVRPGGALTFVNQDPATSIFHTVTGCAAPCSQMGGIGFPLANGGLFDSGELGFGPAGLTAAAGRIDYQLPKTLKPGTYTYFCRLHPWMRGAFRVNKRAPRRS